MTSESHGFDVVVAGCGIAGLSAAVSALEEGASVAVIERAPLAERGGNTRYTEAYLRMKSDTEVTDDFSAHFAENSGGYLDPTLVEATQAPYASWPGIVKALAFADPEVVSAFADACGPTVQWLKRLGVRFDFLPTQFLTASQPRLLPIGGGLALLEALAAQVDRMHGRFFYQTTARALVQDDSGAVVVDSDAAVRALTWMRDAIHRDRIAPDASLTWQEEQARFAFQNGDAALMRNRPYAWALLQAGNSGVAGRVGVAPMPSQPDGGTPTATLGGAQLAVNTRSKQPDAAWTLIQFLTAPEQMLERARRVGQFPSRPSLFDAGSGLEGSLGIPADAAKQVLMAARPRPVTPLYTQLSEILQIRLHRALSRQQDPRSALDDAARDMRRQLARAGL